MKRNNLSTDGFGIDRVRKNVQQYLKRLQDRFTYRVTSTELSNFSLTFPPLFSDKAWGSEFVINGQEKNNDNSTVNDQRVEICIDEKNRVVVIFTFNVNNRKNCHYVGLCRSNEFEDKFTNKINSFLQSGSFTFDNYVKEFDGNSWDGSECIFFNEFFETEEYKKYAKK